MESISGIVDETTGAVSVCALFDNSDGILLSGGTGVQGAGTRRLDCTQGHPPRRV